MFGEYRRVLVTGVAVSVALVAVIVAVVLLWPPSKPKQATVQKKISPEVTLRNQINKAKHEAVSGQTAKATSDLNQILKQKITALQKTEVLLALANLYSQENDFKNAESSLKQADALRPHDLSIVSQLAQAADSAHDNPVAIAYYKEWAGLYADPSAPGVASQIAQINARLSALEAK